MKNAKRFLAMLLGILMLAGCASDPADQATTLPTAPETTKPSRETQPAETPAEASLKALRKEMDKYTVFGAAFFDYHDTLDSDEPVDPYSTMEEYAPKLCKQYPFLLEIPEENVVGGDNGELICIVPKNPKSSVRISRCTWTGEEYIFDDLIYESDKGDPVLLFCNNSGIGCDTQVVITAPDGTETVWTPLLDNNHCLWNLWDEDGNPQILDFSPYWEILLWGYNNAYDQGWLPITEEMLADTTWTGWDLWDDGTEYQYQVTFHAGHTADIRWHKGGEQEYQGAPWKIFERNGFPVLSIDLGGMAGILEYNGLLESELGLLHMIQDISDSKVEPGTEPLRRLMSLAEPAAPDPENMIGSWDRAWTEVEGDRVESAPGSCTIEIYRDENGTLRITYTDNAFPEESFKDKELAVFDGEMYYGCGNDKWVADVGHIGPMNTYYAVTLLEDGTLLMQTYWEFEGQMYTSYAWFSRK